MEKMKKLFDRVLEVSCIALMSVMTILVTIFSISPVLSARCWQGICLCGWCFCALPMCLD